MHNTAFTNAQLFADTYVKALGPGVSVVEIGSQDVNGSIRPCFGAEVQYCGVDFAAGKGVDVVLDDPYSLPFADGSIDVIACSSVFEHSEFFWLTFVEMARILKPTGLIYLNVPSNGPFHGYPVDCWRFYPDSGVALMKWAIKQGQPVKMLESFTTPQSGGVFNDFVAVFAKEPVAADHHPRRMASALAAFENGYVYGHRKRINAVGYTEDQRVMNRLKAMASSDADPQAIKSLINSRLVE